MLRNDFCSGSDFFVHQLVIDHRNGSLVCTACARVMQDTLTYDEIYYPTQSSTQVQKAQPEDKIDGDLAGVYLTKIGDRLNISQSSIDNTLDKFVKVKEEIAQMVSKCKGLKQKRTILCEKNLMLYSLHNTLKEESCPRSIREICKHAGIPHTNIRVIEKFLETKEKTHITPRLIPITAKDILLTHYAYIDEVTFEDVKQMFHLLNAIEPCNFSPLTAASGIAFLYINYIKKSKSCSASQISSLFHVTTMSIRRFVKKYKSILCEIN